jgi:hypothetical protein
MTSPIRSYTIRLPDTAPLLNANTRMPRRTHIAFNAAIRQLAQVTAKNLLTRRTIAPMDYVHVYYVIHPPVDNRRRDPGNWAPSAKAALDGIVLAGLLPDDNSRHVVGPDGRLGTPGPRYQLDIILTDLTTVPPGLMVVFDPTRQLDLYDHLATANT